MLAGCVVQRKLRVVAAGVPSSWGCRGWVWCALRIRIRPEVRGVRVVSPRRGDDRCGRGSFLDLERLHSNLALSDLLFQTCEVLQGLV